MIKCDLCKQDIKHKDLCGISWNGEDSHSGELHFHKGCFCHALSQLSVLMESHEAKIMFGGDRGCGSVSTFVSGDWTL